MTETAGHDAEIAGHVGPKYAREHEGAILTDVPAAAEGKRNASKKDSI